MMYICLHKDANGNKLPVIDKVKYLLSIGATVIPKPDRSDIPKDTIAITHGYFYEMCMYIHDATHLDLATTECKPLIFMHYEGAEKLSNYKFFTRPKPPFIDVSQYGKEYQDR